MNQKIDDEFIINYFYLKTNPNKIDHWKTRNIPEEIKQYLYNRYNDIDNTTSINEIIQRIRFGIEQRPKCKVCNNNYTTYIRLGVYKATCCKECENIYKALRTKEAMLEKYGVDNISKLQEIKDKKKKSFNEHYPENSEKRAILLANASKKFKETCKEKYGAHPMQIDKIKNKSIENLKKSMLEKYGVEYYYQTDIFKAKFKDYSLKTYGTEFVTQAEVNREKNRIGMCEHGIEKYKITCKEKYGVEHWAKSDDGHKKLASIETQEKQYNTKKKNKSYAKSKIEDKIYDILKIYFPDTIHNYFSQEYPFNCDFYIPCLNLYIEYQGTWMHGGHPFNENDKSDQVIIEQWENKSKEISFNGKPKISYKCAINVWTKSDVLKRDIAKQNNLNYKELWSFEEAKQYVESLIK